MTEKTVRTNRQPVRGDRQPARTNRQPVRGGRQSAGPDRQPARGDRQPARTDRRSARSNKKSAPKNKPVKKNKPLRIIGFLIGTAAILAVLFSMSTLKTVTVEDNVLYDQSEIADVILTDNYSWNTLYVYIKYLFTEPEELPFVDSLDIRITGLHSLNVRVNAKDMAGYLYVSGQNCNAYFDGDGTVVETSGKVVESITKVTGITCTEAQKGSIISVNQSLRKELLELMQALRRKELIPDEIIYGEANSPILIFGNVQINIGDTNLLTQKVERAAAIYPDIKNMSGVLHLENWNAASGSIIFSKDTDDTAASGRIETNSETTEETSTEGNAAEEKTEADSSADPDTAGEAAGENAEGTADPDAEGEAAEKAEAADGQ